MTGTDDDEWRYDEDAQPTDNADADADAAQDREPMPASSAGAAVIGGVLLGLAVGTLLMGHLNWGFGYMVILALFAVGWRAAAASGR